MQSCVCWKMHRVSMSNTAAKIAAEHFGIQATARPLPSERDQNFLLTNSAGEKFVLKIANALESREFLEAQNAVLNHLAKAGLDFCQSLVPGVAGEEIVDGQSGALTSFAWSVIFPVCRSLRSIHSRRNCYAISDASSDSWIGAGRLRSSSSAS